MALQAQIASQENKELLAKSLFYLRQPSTGSVDGDVRRLSTLIHEWVANDVIDENMFTPSASLIVELGLQSSLSEYKVPTQDLSTIAGRALGNPDDPLLSEVVKLLERLYV